MITYAEALQAILALPLAGDHVRLPLAGALGRVLAEDLSLAADQPPFDRATMDGYAVVLESGRTRFRVVGSVAAGAPCVAELTPGNAVRIMTGAAVPPGTTVVPYEQAQVDADSIEVEVGALATGRNIAWRGEDGRCGAVVVAKGTRLSPTTIAAAAMCAAETVRICVPPRLAIITTGDEVGQRTATGINDTNGPFLAALAALLRCPARCAHIPDEPSALLAGIAGARAQSEVIVTTGGVSGSATDLVPAAAVAAGFQVVFHHVAMQPGKPVLLARHPDGQVLVGLPGNAVSVVMSAHLILLPVLGRWLGGWHMRWSEVPLASARLVPARRQQFLPARLQADGAQPLPWNGSGDLIAAAAGEGIVELPCAIPLAQGMPVRFMPYLGDSAGGVAIIPQRRGSS